MYVCYCTRKVYYSIKRKKKITAAAAASTSAFALKVNTDNSGNENTHISYVCVCVHFLVYYLCLLKVFIFWLHLVCFVINKYILFKQTYTLTHTTCIYIARVVHLISVIPYIIIIIIGSLCCCCSIEKERQR